MTDVRAADLGSDDLWKYVTAEGNFGSDEDYRVSGLLTRVECPVSSDRPVVLILGPAEDPVSLFVNQDVVVVVDRSATKKPTLHFAS